MPIYEYRCQSCGKEMEATQRIVDPPLTECPACHKPALERLISATSFQLKGSGWYKDGYGTKQQKSDSSRVDRLEKAIKDDKAKTEAASTSDGESSKKDDGGGSSAPSKVEAA
jgi:putative FmdB family regulatory protein